MEFLFGSPGEMKETKNDAVINGHQDVNILENSHDGSRVNLTQLSTDGKI